MPGGPWRAGCHTDAEIRRPSVCQHAQRHERALCLYAATEGVRRVEPRFARSRLSAMRLPIVCLLLVAASACHGSAQPAASRQTDVDLSGQWRLVSGEFQAGSFDSSSEASLTLVVSGLDAGNQAHAGCMVVDLNPRVSGSSVTLAEIDRGSMLSCPPNTPQTEFDEPYLEALTAVDRATRSGAGLTLTGPGVRLTYHKVG